MYMRDYNGISFGARGKEKQNKHQASKSHEDKNYQEAADNLMYPKDHSPPHFHVIKDDWNIRIKFNLCAVRRGIVWDCKYPKNLKAWPLKSHEAKTLLDLIQKNCKALNKQWKALH